MTITTRLFSYFYGKRVGVDVFGNVYYTERKPTKGQKAKRWVMYNGSAEPSKVPAEWHGWLHYTLDKTPGERTIPEYKWMKPHLPNLTGTVNAYVPPGSLLRDAKRDSSTADYQPWQPS